mmetsp:Transcript_38985/g.107323  ORF Transcript_38985/g.107323 Transcript_38985/m.107323 type:complete len:408 (-) Transcript_38985:90-1313(-)
MDALESVDLAHIDEKGFVPDEVRNTFFRKLRMKNENRTCFECSARNPTWISLTYGVYLCLECSGEHRRKGVHLSFVRSVELDKFSPDQMVQMACGGNGKAWNYFKQHGMGKTSDTGRALDYNSKITIRYKQQIETETVATCGKLGVPYKPGSQSAQPAASAADSPNEATASPKPSTVVQSVSKSAISAPAPKPAMPTSVVVRKATADPVNSGSGGGYSACPPATTSPTTTAPAAKAASAAGFAAGTKAKQIEFDFDFDELEAEAAKPSPPPPAASTPTPATTSAPKPASKPVVEARPPSQIMSQSVEPKYQKAKAISSDDFFHEADSESAQARLDRDMRYNKFNGSAAISSDSFFGNGDPDCTDGRSMGGNGADDWKDAARRGSDIARAGISKGAELFTTYLSKVRD